MSVALHTKRCWVAYATHERQYLWSIELPQGASVRDALAAARTVAGDATIPWEEGSVGIFGEPCSRTHVPRDGDRIELYRPLVHDPKHARRERVRQSRKRERPR